MKDSIRQRSAGSWDLTVDIGHDPHTRHATF